MQWQLKYGAFDLLIEKVDGEGNRWQYDYDKDTLKLSQVTNPKGETYRYRFNENGQVVEEIDFADNRWRYSYNLNGTLQTLTDGEGNVTHYEYDKAYNLTRLMTADDSFIYTYDTIGRITDIQSIQQQLHFEYDIQDRIVKEVQRFGEIHRTYDDENQTVTRTLIIEGQAPLTTVFKYNAVGELVQLDLPNISNDSTESDETSGQKPQLFCQYDQNGNEIRRTSNQGFVLKQRFDEMDCLIHQRAGWEPKHFFDKDELQSTGIDSPTFAELNKTYGYDKALNTTATKDKQEQLTFTLNKNNQITQVHNQHREQEQYRYDQNGYLAQRTVGFEDIAQHISHDEIYQKGNKLNRINDDYYRYDNAGRLLEKTEIQNGFRQKTTYYRWNASNQLIGITTNRGEVWYYKYDGLGRRIAKECPQRDLKIEYLWDGDQLAYTQTFKNDKLESKRHSVFNGWQLLAQQDWYSELEQNHNGNIIHQRAETSYAITQPNGKVLALFNPQGRKVWSEELKSIWGLRLNALFSYAKPSPFNPQMLFAGQWVDEESGLAYNRFRYYNPTTANYLCSDPIGLQGGETPYGYARNPWDWVDVLGLARCPSKYSHLTREQRQVKINELAEANARRRLQEMQAQNPRSHFFDRHGAQTTLQQQQVRAQTGLNPEGGQGRIPPAATRFLSHRDQLNAIQRAQTIYRQTGKTAPSVSFTSVVGEGYRGAQYFQTQQAKVVFRGSESNIITAFPE